MSFTSRARVVFDGPFQVTLSMARNRSQLCIPSGDCNLCPSERFNICYSIHNTPKAGSNKYRAIIFVTTQNFDHQSKFSLGVRMRAHRRSTWITWRDGTLSIIRGALFERTFAKPNATIMSIVSLKSLDNKQYSHYSNWHFTNGSVVSLLFKCPDPPY